MSYLEKAKRAKGQKLTDPKELRVTKEANYTNKGLGTAQTTADSLRNNFLDRLPWQLERLLSAASSDLLPKDAVMLGDGLVTDLNRYTLAWGCTYLIGDRDEALRRLWQAHRAWRGVN